MPTLLSAICLRNVRWKFLLGVERLETCESLPAVDHRQADHTIANQWFGVSDKNALPSLLKRSREYQGTVTEDLAEQVFAGLETLLPLSLALYHKGSISLLDLLDRLTAAPGKILGLESGRALLAVPRDAGLDQVAVLGVHEQPVARGRDRGEHRRPFRWTRRPVLAGDRRVARVRRRVRALRTG